MDPAVILFGLGAVRLWLRGGLERAPGWRRAALAGACIGVASLFHVLGLIWGPALAAGDLAARRRVAWRPLLIAGVCAAIPLAVWMLVICARGDLPAWQEQFLEMAVRMRAAHQPWWIRPWLEFRRCLGDFQLTPLLGLAVVGGGASWFARGDRARPSFRFLIGAFVASTALVTFVMQKDTGAYPLYWQVWIVMAAGLGWAGYLESGARRATLPGRALLLGGLLNGALLAAFTLAVALYQRAGRDYRYVEEFALQHIAKGSNVVGPPQMWYAVEDAGANLRIWRDPDAAQDDFLFKLPQDPAPRGFEKIGTIPERLPKIAGRYFSHITYAYELWVSDERRFRPPRH